MTIDIYINEDGTVQHIYDDAVADLFDEDDITVRRASHVEPVPGGWTADMSPVGGPVLWDDDERRIPFKNRADALAAERQWLNAHMAERQL